MKKNKLNKMIVASIAFILLITGIIAVLHFWGGKEKTIRIGYSKYEYPPFHYKDENGQLIGFDINLAMTAAGKMGVNFKFIPIDWLQKEELLVTKEVDILWGGLEHATLDKNKVKFTAPYLQSEIVLVMNQDKDYKEWQDLQGKEICVLNFTPAYDYYRAYNKNLIKGKLVSSPLEYKQLIQDFNKFDCLIADKCLAEFLNRENGDKYKISDKLLNVSFSAATRSEDTKLFDDLQNALEELKTDGTIAMLEKQWISSN